MRPLPLIPPSGGSEHRLVPEPVRKNPPGLPVVAVGILPPPAPALGLERIPPALEGAGHVVPGIVKAPLNAAEGGALPGAELHHPRLRPDGDGPGAVPQGQILPSAVRQSGLGKRFQRVTAKPHILPQEAVPQGETNDERRQQRGAEELPPVFPHFAHPISGIRLAKTHPQA